jgi:hypothetical protein
VRGVEELEERPRAAVARAARDVHLRGEERVGERVVRVRGAALARVRQAGVQRAHVGAEEELGSRVDCEARDEVLEVDGAARGEACAQCAERGLRVPLEDLKVGDALTREEGTRDAAVELPEVAVGIEDAVTQRIREEAVLSVYVRCQSGTRERSGEAHSSCSRQSPSRESS